MEVEVAPVAEQVEPGGLGLGELVLEQDDRLVEGGDLVQLGRGAGYRGPMLPSLPVCCAAGRCRTPRPAGGSSS